MSAEFMLERKRMDEADRTLAARVSHSAKRMQRMIGDLLDFTQSRLGNGIPIVRARMDMEEVLRGVVAEPLHGAIKTPPAPIRRRVGHAAATV